MMAKKFEEFIDKHIDPDKLTKKEAERYISDMKKIVKDMDNKQRMIKNCERSFKRSCIYFTILLLGGLISCFTPKEWMLEAWVSLITAVFFITFTVIDNHRKMKEDKFNKKKSL